MAAGRPWRLTRTLRPGDDPALHVGHWRVVVFTPGPVPARPRTGRTVVTLGYVHREGSYGWVAHTAYADPERSWGGYHARVGAAECLWDDWRAENLRLPLLVDGKVLPSPLDQPGRP